MISRAALARSAGSTSRRVVVRRSWPRFQSTGTTGGSKVDVSHLAAGIGGGSLVLLVGYGYYHTSGLKTAVQTTKEIKSYFQSSKDSLIQTARESAKNPSETLRYLRGVAKSYVVFIPGAASYVDATFDAFDELHDTHGEEVDKILKETSDELSKATQVGGADAKTATKVYEILRTTTSKLQELSKKVGGTLLDKNPALKEKLGEGYEQLRSLAEGGGPEAKKIFDDVSEQVKEIASKGKLDDETLQKVKKLLQEKSSNLRKMVASKSGLVAGGPKEALQSLLGNIPGSDQILEKAPHLNEIANLTRARGDEAKQLAKETLQEIVNVLEEKGKKAKQLADRSKDEAKSKIDKQ